MLIDYYLGETTGSAAAVAQPPCRVLLVDDDEMPRTRLAAQLRLAHYDVHTARTGEDALRFVRETPCQIVIAGWHLPDMDGVTLCRSLRSRDHASYVYLVLWTTRKHSRDALKGLAAGADDCVVKGSSLQEMLARIEVGRRITRRERAVSSADREDGRRLSVDPLTGLPNLHSLMKSLSRELRRSQRYEHPLAVLSCDLDGFKEVNERFGREAGDDLLRAFSDRSAACLRKSSDWLARTGADEFVVVLPETAQDGAVRVAAKLRQSLAQEPVITFGGPVRCTVSIGAVALETVQQLASFSVVEMLRSADRDLHNTAAYAMPVRGSGHAGG
jgi:two-component system cell cycle response regulator